MIRINNLVFNGCSYAEVYANGGGHLDLAQRLNIDNASSLAIGGSANSRILRTTLKHSYQTTEPTLYVLGLTFVSRGEIPILKVDNEETSFEGRWVNPQNQEFSNRWEHYWNKSESEKFVDLKLKIELYSLLDRTEDLMYHMLSTIYSLQARGHRVLMYQQADTSYQTLLTNPRLQPFTSMKNIINGFEWRGIGYQHEHNVETGELRAIQTWVGPKDVPLHMRHPAVGAHQIINEYLYNYIINNNIMST